MELKGRQALKVQALAGVHPYKQFADKEETVLSKMWGKNYRRFAYEGKAFVVEEGHKFCKEYDNNEIYSIDLVLADDMLSFANHTNIHQEINMAKTEQLLRSYENTVVTTPKVLDEETINALR